MRLNELFIASSENRGRGVYTSEMIEQGAVLEIAPVIVMSATERVLLDKTLLHDYIFEWGEDKTKCAMALGWIPLYNHSYHSNAEYYMDFEEEAMFVKAVREISAGEEVTINYNGDWNNQQKVWFDVK